MPRRISKTRAVGGRRRYQGDGFFDFAKKAFNGIKKVVDFVKPTGLISKTAGLLPVVGSQAEALLKSKGYGRKRRSKRGGARVVAF